MRKLQEMEENAITTEGCWRRRKLYKGRAAVEGCGKGRS
jgi:hypothetical protein